MAYTDIISLSDAKLYLRIDDTLTEDDNNITRMIKGAFLFIEEFTNVRFIARDVRYLFNNGRTFVYDYPINSEVDVPTDVKSKEMTMWSMYTTCTDSVAMQLNVGYVNPTSVPQDLIDVAYELIEISYYGKDTGKTNADLSDYSMAVLYQNKRFLV